MIPTDTLHEGYIRPSLRMSAARQRAILIEHGIDPDRIWTEGDGAETMQTAINLCESGHILVVARLDVVCKLGSRLADTLQHLAERGVRLYVCSVGREVDPADAAVGADARRIIAGERRVPDPEMARKWGMRGGKPLSWSRLNNGEKIKAREIWNAADSVADAMTKFASQLEWEPSRSTVYRLVKAGHLPPNPREPGFRR